VREIPLLGLRTRDEGSWWGQRAGRQHFEEHRRCVFDQKSVVHEQRQWSSVKDALENLREEDRRAGVAYREDARRYGETAFAEKKMASLKDWPSRSLAKRVGVSKIALRPFAGIHVPLVAGRALRGCLWEIRSI
jgi:hypothetical protein